MKPPTSLFMRPTSKLVYLFTLCLCAAWLNSTAETTTNETKKKEAEEETAKSSKARAKKTAPKAKPKAPAPTPSTEKSAPKQETGAAPKATDSAKAKETDAPKQPAATKEPTPPSKAAEPPPKDVTTSNRAATRQMEGKDGGEFDHDDEAKTAATSKPTGGKSTTTTSSDMPGWDLERYHERDYVSAQSLHRFYRFNNLEVRENNVWLRSPQLIMKAVIGSQDLLINNIKFVLSDPVIELNNKPCFSRLDLCKLIDPVLRPSYINTANQFDTVILDAGHGGHDTGARGIYGYEKDFALKLAFAVKADLEKRGLKVVLTRKDDSFISLRGRVAIANTIPNSIYVSLHFNSGGSSATGIETFALTPQGGASVYGARSVDAYSFSGNQRDSENIALATAIHAAVVHHFKLVDRGVKRARWYVLKGLERPGVLFEGGFVTNASDAKLIAADNFRLELASTLGQAVMNYRRALQTPPSR
ncbi:MAG: N-acetylmuramoyl-L-alanine amidase [Roseimicrobium sp.]